MLIISLFMSHAMGMQNPADKIEILEVDGSRTGDGLIVDINWVVHDSTAPGPYYLDIWLAFSPIHNFSRGMRLQKGVMADLSTGSIQLTPSPLWRAHPQLEATVAFFASDKQRISNEYVVKLGEICTNMIEDDDGITGRYDRAFNVNYTHRRQTR